MVKKPSLQEFQLQDFLLSQQHKPCQTSLEMPNDKLLETLEMFPTYLEMLSPMVLRLEMVSWMDSDVRTRTPIRAALLKKPKWRKQMKMIDLSLRNIGKYMPYGTYVMPLDTPSISLHTLVQFWKSPSGSRAVAMAMDRFRASLWKFHRYAGQKWIRF